MYYLSPLIEYSDIEESGIDDSDKDAHYETESEDTDDDDDGVVNRIRKASIIEKHLYCGTK